LTISGVATALQHIHQVCLLFYFFYAKCSSSIFRSHLVNILQISYIRHMMRTLQYGG
jgi:hypothetical protein